MDRKGLKGTKRKKLGSKLPQMEQKGPNKGPKIQCSLKKMSKKA